MQRGMQSKLIKAKSIPLNYRKSNQKRERERERERERKRELTCNLLCEERIG